MIDYFHGRPSPTQLARWLADGHTALRLAAAPLRLWDVLARQHANPRQRRAVLARLMDTARTKLESASTWLAAHATTGRATLAGWMGDFAGVMAPHLYAGVMAVLGTTGLAPADVQAADQEVTQQYLWLGRFRDQLAIGQQALWAPAPVATGPLTPGGPSSFLGGRNPTISHGKPAPRLPAGSLLSRSGMYADAAWSVAENVLRAKMGRDGYTLERAIMGGERHCGDCLSRAALGWQPIFSLVPIGGTVCRSRCRCHMEYSHLNITNTIIASQVIRP